MTNEEVMKRLDYARTNCTKSMDYDMDCDMDCEHCMDAMDTAIETLEKEIPKKPIRKKRVYDGYAWEWVCPNCLIVKASPQYQFCFDCGQKLDWSDNND